MTTRCKIPGRALLNVVKDKLGSIHDKYMNKALLHYYCKTAEESETLKSYQKVLNH